MYAPNKTDATKYNILFQLLALPTAYKGSEYTYQEHSKTTERILNIAIGDERTEKKWVWHPDLKEIDKKARILPPFEELKKRAAVIAMILEDEYDHIPEEKRKNMEEFVNAAIKLAERLAEIKAKGEKATRHIKAGKVPEFEEFVDAFKKVAPEEMIVRQKKKPSAKYPKVQKQIETEPRTKSLPEDTKLEVLSILQALEFADYSEKAKEKALGKLASMLEELSKEKLTPENLQKIGLVAFAIGLIKRSEFERVEEIKKL
ncbi:hypothetical protein [Thermococcus sp.]|uniref:hypothetical protein n=1 Tax=Thermococcus sp. TaxID=35749 RepID=UPI00260EF916|nr:hypothetical protein [Thermococcus sp.]